MPKKSAFDLTLIILNYNSQFWLKKTLSSLKEFYLNHTKYKIKVVVVDNNSEDDSVKIVRQSFRWVELMELKTNLGFSAGNNQALRNLNSRYVMLLNNDIEFTPQSNLDTLINYMDERKQVAVITPKLVLPDGSIDLACHRGEPTPWASIFYFLKLEKMFPQSTRFAEYHQLYKDFNTIHEIDACSGAAMLIRVWKLKEVGLLDEDFFMYGEDLDWCKRFRKKGSAVVFHPGVTLIHHKYKSGIKSTSLQTATQVKRQFYNAMLQYYDKHHRHEYPRFYRWILRLILFVKKGGL